MGMNLGMFSRLAKRVQIKFCHDARMINVHRLYECKRNIN